MTPDEGGGRSDGGERYYHAFNNLAQAMKRMGVLCYERNSPGFAECIDVFLGFLCNSWMSCDTRLVTLVFSRQTKLQTQCYSLHSLAAVFSPHFDLTLI